MKRQPSATASPYNETQIRHWLVWLARGMVQHGQTVFLIERLQPSWLASRWQYRIYVMASRLLWGVLIGGLTGALFGGLFGAPIAGLLLGLIVGLSVAAVAGLLAGTGVGPFIGYVVGPLVGGLGTLAASFFTNSAVKGEAGVIVGFVVGIMWLARNAQQRIWGEVHAVEGLAWSWQHGIYAGCFVLVFGLLIALWAGRAFGVEGTCTGIVGVLVVVGMTAAIGGLFSGLGRGVQEMKTRPNQGISLSLRYSLLLMGTSGLVVGLVALAWSRATSGLVYGIIVGVFIGLWYGGLDALQHYILRTVLWINGSAPLNYARFLDYAANELNFLQKVGGGYIFVHRFLLEHFAAMEGGGAAGQESAHHASHTAPGRLGS